MRGRSKGHKGIEKIIKKMNGFLYFISYIFLLILLGNVLYYNKVKMNEWYGILMLYK